MTRILKNKTDELCEVICYNRTVEIPADDEADLSEKFAAWELAASESLLLLLAQGVDRYQLNDGSRDLTAVEAIELVRGYHEPQARCDDGRVFVAPNLFPIGYLTQFTGVGDDIEDGIEGGGSLITLSSSQVEEVDLEVQFLKAYYLAGGSASWAGAVVGDWVSFQLHAPATAGTSNPGAGAYSKYPIGTGMNMYVPHPTQQGDWDLDLEETLNENVDFTKVVPVSASNTDGFFDWNMDTGAVTLNAGQTGGYNLFDFEVPLHTFVRKVPLIGSSAEPFTVPAIKPYLCLPHWHIHLKLNNSTAKSLALGAFIYRGIK